VAGKLCDLSEGKCGEQIFKGREDFSESEVKFNINGKELLGIIEPHCDKK